MGCFAGAEGRSFLPVLDAVGAVDAVDQGHADDVIVRGLAVVVALGDDRGPWGSRLGGRDRGSRSRGTGPVFAVSSAAFRACLRRFALPVDTGAWVSPLSIASRAASIWS